MDKMGNGAAVPAAAARGVEGAEGGGGEGKAVVGVGAGAGAVEGGNPHRRKTHKISTRSGGCCGDERTGGLLRDYNSQVICGLAWGLSATCARGATL